MPHLTPYPDTQALIAGVVIVGMYGALILAAWLKTRQSPKALLPEDQIPPLEDISPALAWIVFRRANGVHTLTTKESFDLLASILVRMMKQGFMERKAVRRGRDDVLRFVRTGATAQECGLYEEERAIADALFLEGDDELDRQFIGSVSGRAYDMMRAFDLSLRAQCVGPLVINNYFWSLSLSGIAVMFGVAYTILLVPPGDAQAFTGIGAFIGLFSALLWMMGRYTPPFRLWSAALTLAVISAGHVAIAFSQADAIATGGTAAFFHPGFLAGLWLGGLTLMTWEGLRTLTPKGHAILSALMAEHRHTLTKRQAQANASKGVSAEIEAAFKPSGHPLSIGGSGQGVYQGLIFGLNEHRGSANSDSVIDRVEFPTLTQELSNAISDGISGDGDGGGD